MFPDLEGTFSIVTAFSTTHTFDATDTIVYEEFISLVSHGNLRFDVSEYREVPASFKSLPFEAVSGGDGGCPWGDSTNTDEEAPIPKATIIGIGWGH